MKTKNKELPNLYFEINSFRVVQREKAVELTDGNIIVSFQYPPTKKHILET